MSRRRTVTWLVGLRGLALAVGCGQPDQTSPSVPPPARPSIPSLTVGPVLDDGRLRVGGSVQMTLTTNVTADSVRWTIADTSIAVVSATGLVTGRGVGESGLVVRVFYERVGLLTAVLPLRVVP